MRESGHFGSALVSVGTAREHQSEKFACKYRIIRICLIKITDAIQKQCLRVLRLNTEILFQQRCILSTLSHKVNLNNSQN